VIHALAAAALLCPHTAPAALEPSDYPQQDFLLIGTVPTTLEPSRSFQFKAPMNGSLELMISSTSGTAQAGTLLARMDRERLELEGAVLQLEAAYSRIREIPEQKLAALQQLRQLENRSSEIGQQLDFLSEIEQKPEFASLFTENVETFHAEKSGMTQQLQQERALAEDLLHKLQDPASAKLGEQLAGMKLKQRQLDYQQRLRDSQLRMPFDGHYRVLLPSGADRSAYSILQGDPILLAEDRSALFGVVEVKGDHWRSLPQEKLCLNLPAAAAFSPEESGRFARSVLEHSARRPRLFYHFKFDSPRLERIEQLRGGIITAELLLDLRDSTAYVIPKADLLAAFPSSFGGGWADGLRRQFESIRDVYVGQHAVAVTYEP